MIRLLRGQVVVRQLTEHTGRVIIPDYSRREYHRDAVSHRGVVLAMGAPAQMPNGVEVAPGFQVGDVVQFHWSHNEENFTHEWEDGRMACWIAQDCVDAVLE